MLIKSCLPTEHSNYITTHVRDTTPIQERHIPAPKLPDRSATLIRSPVNESYRGSPTLAVARIFPPCTFERTVSIVPHFNDSLVTPGCTILTPSRKNVTLRCRCTANGSFASCITYPSMTCVSTFGLIVAFGMPPLSALLPVFGGNPPVVPVEGVVTHDVAVEPAVDTLPLVESNPFGPILLTGMADVPVTVAIAVVVEAVVEVEEVVLLAVPPLVIVVVVDDDVGVEATEPDAPVDVGVAVVASGFVVSSIAADGAELTAPPVTVVVPGALLTVVIPAEVGVVEAADCNDGKDATAASADRALVTSPPVPFVLPTPVVVVPGAGVVSIGVLAVPFNCASDALSVAAAAPAAVDVCSESGNKINEKNCYKSA
uniref:Uncharacterized protein n=1 Tax=Anopheles farauti TaxID=69004 RepID=A0A182QNL0_9DIPT